MTPALAHKREDVIVEQVRLAHQQEDVVMEQVRLAHKREGVIMEQVRGCSRRLKVRISSQLKGWHGSDSPTSKRMAMWRGLVDR